ncbi:MAG TPA: uracil-DNA glycosylase [Gaiellaceae bacterium]
MRASSASTDLVDRLAAARIGATFNQYAGSELRQSRLREYLERRADAPILLVGEAAGYRGARVSGLPFTSERQLTGSGPAETTATIVHHTLAELGLEEDVLLWNAVPTHPGTESSNRRPTRREVEAGRRFLEELARGRRVVAVGRVAAAATGAPYVRHPSHGGAADFRIGLAEAAVRPRRPRRVSDRRGCLAGAR